MMSICLGLPGYNFDEPSSKVSSRTSLFCTLDFSHVREKKLLYVGFRCATCLLRLWWCGWKACMPIYRGLRKRVTILFHGLTYYKLSWYSNLFQHCLRNNNICSLRGFRLWSPSFCPLFPSIALPSGFFVNSLAYHFTGAWEFHSTWQWSKEIHQHSFYFCFKFWGIDFSDSKSHPYGLSDPLFSKLQGFWYYGDSYTVEKRLSWGHFVGF